MIAIPEAIDNKGFPALACSVLNSGGRRSSVVSPLPGAGVRGPGQHPGCPAPEQRPWGCSCASALKCFRSLPSALRVRVLHISQTTGGGYPSAGEGRVIISLLTRSPQQPASSSSSLLFVALASFKYRLCQGHISVFIIASEDAFCLLSK